MDDRRYQYTKAQYDLVIAEAREEKEALFRALDEARAQIAAKDAALRDLLEESYKTQQQIAAKDAALRECRVFADQANMRPTDVWARLMETIDAALAAPALETK